MPLPLGYAGRAADGSGRGTVAGMALGDGERRALGSRLAPGSVDAVEPIAAAVEDGEELREVLVDMDGEVVAFTDRRALFVDAAAVEVRAYDYDAVVVSQRDQGLSVDAVAEADRLVLLVPRSTYGRLGVLPPPRASWLPVPPPRPAPPAPSSPPVAFPGAPPPGWHPDPSRRHWWRWWDGRDWTGHVADGGPPFVDPLPPKR